MSVSQWRVGRLIATAIVGLAFAGIVAACGDSEDGSDESAQRTDATDRAPTTTGSEEAGGREGGGDSRARAGDGAGASGGSGGASDGAGDDSGSGDGAGDGSGGGASGGAGTDDSDAGGGSRVEGEIASTVTGMYRDIAEGDAAGVCAVMTRAAREQIAQNVPGGSGEAPADRTCEASLGKFLEAAATSGLAERTLGTTVERVRVDGRRATVTIRAAGQTGKVELLREDGEWRFGADAVGASRRGG